MSRGGHDKRKGERGSPGALLVLFIRKKLEREEKKETKG